MIGTRRGFRSLHQAIIGALFGFVLALPVAAAAEPAAEAAAPQHGGGGFALLLLREALQRIKHGFDAAGIQFAYPTVTIHSTAGAPPPDDQAIQAAARMAIRAPANDLPMPA